MILPVGKPTIEIAELDEDGNKGAWQAIDVPVDGTTSLETEEGERTEYLEEGGGVVDAYQKQSKYTLNFTLYAKKGVEKPIADNNGVIVKNYAIRLTPEDPECKGFIMHKCSVSCQETYTSADGVRWAYKFSGLVSEDTAEILDEYIKATSFDMSVNYLAFASDAEPAQTATANLGAGSSVTATASDNWITTSVSGLEVSVTTSANSGLKRIGYVTVTSDSGKKSKVKIIQAGATA